MDPDFDTLITRLCSVLEPIDIRVTSFFPLSSHIPFVLQECLGLPEIQFKTKMIDSSKCWELILVLFIFQKVHQTTGKKKSELKDFIISQLRECVKTMKQQKEGQTLSWKIHQESLLGILGEGRIELVQKEKSLAFSIKFN